MTYKPKMIGIDDIQEPLFIYPQLLYHPNIPKPLHGLNPRTLLGEEWWNIVRNEAYKKNNHCCWACGIHQSNAKHHQWLEAHECYEYDYARGIGEMKLVVALCHLCHNYIHNGRLQERLESNEITLQFYNEVMSHGTEIKSKAREEFPPELKFIYNTLKNLQTLENGKDKITGLIDIARWKDWVLIIDGKEYKPLYKNYDEWFKHYHG